MHQQHTSESNNTDHHEGRRLQDQDLRVAVAGDKHPQKQNIDVIRCLDDSEPPSSLSNRSRRTTKDAGRAALVEYLSLMRQVERLHARSKKAKTRNKNKNKKKKMTAVPRNRARSSPDPRIELIRSELALANKRLDRIEDRMGCIKEDMRCIKEEMRDIKEDVNDLKTIVKSVKEVIEQLKSENQSLHLEIQSIKVMQDICHRLVMGAARLQASVADLDSLAMTYA